MTGAEQRRTRSSFQESFKTEIKSVFYNHPLCSFSFFFFFPFFSSSLNLFFTLQGLERLNYTGAICLSWDEGFSNSDFSAEISDSGFGLSRPSLTYGL